MNTASNLPVSSSEAFFTVTYKHNTLPLFSSDFKEKNLMEIELPNKSHDDIVELMQLMHPPYKQITGVLQPLPLLVHVIKTNKTNTTAQKQIF